MSGSTNNFPVVPTRGNRRPGEGYDAGASNANDWNGVHAAMFPRPHFRAGQNSTGGYQVPWLPTDDERGRRGPWGLSRFPEPPISPLPLRADEIARNYVLLRPGQYVPEPPPRFVAPSLQLPTHQEEESRLSRDEQKKALNKLKKEIYNPTPKRLAKRLSLYYRDSADATATATARNSRFNEKGDEEYEEKCAICLDDLEPKQLIIRTPCDHMFHEDCIVPWVKSHGQCPVCRFAIGEQMKQNLVPPNNNIQNLVPPNNNITTAHVPIDLLIELVRWDI
ncbi:hypothetical protein RHSIM_RhsimUnG0091400 [Rhododendron simsii]|uniref:RING-type E3 ubiquitin transferase n=1 Tax=Rhododendron simsii TaxID=118357 RepID=A0A834L514_RHOSS|nr:hypothetical protein RHSIM_RhsimUnG0091400 [Rhododendron simsii]